jgi:peptidyl-prolyl cis-trans isomerase B (cyclophilin B)
MQRIFQRWLMVVIVAGALSLGGCVGQKSGDSSAAASPSSTPSASVTPSPVASASPASAPRLNGKATVEMVVKGGTVVIELDGTSAPVTAGNFADLVKKGVYDGLIFHRVVREPQPFVVQGGDPQGKDPNFPAAQLGTGSYLDPATQQARYVPLEIQPKNAAAPVYSKTFSEAGITDAPKLQHKRGAVAMARSQAPDSASSQFYITLADVNFLDGSYAVFGYVTSGMETVDKIQMGDRIESIKITQGAENLKTGQ